jgi:RNA polymerase sigma factor (sigma-70 family)
MGMAYFDDPSLIVDLQNDDVKAFNDIYLRYHLPIYKNVLKLLKDPEEAENMMQEVFVTLWEKRMTLDPLKPVANWLFVVSYNKSKNHLKKTLKEALAFKQVENDFQNVEQVDPYLKEVSLQLIGEAFLNLSPQKKKVFDLCKIQAKTYEETAHELNISKYTVKEYLSIAIKNIRTYVEQHPNNHLISVYIIFVLKRLL